MRIDKVWIDDHAVYAATTDGLMASYDFSRWPSLGRVVTADGKMYASVESATNAGPPPWP